MPGVTQPVQPKMLHDGPELRRELVVLVHGLAANRLFMRPLERHLGRRGFATLNWGYHSVWSTIERHSARLETLLEQLEQDASIERFHLVTHSMGGILARSILTRRTFSKLARIVMLGPPHRGSRVARVLSRVVGCLCQPLSQLSDDQHSFVNQLPEPTATEIGIIAAARDRVVRVEHTRLRQQSAHMIVDAGHSSMLLRRDVAESVERFLRQGTF